MESLSGYNLQDVRVHYNSPLPGRLSAKAYTIGREIHISPAQEKHLPHEMWHVVQQKRSPREPNLWLRNTPVNDDPGLEREADHMGDRARNPQPRRTPGELITRPSPASSAAQLINTNQLSSLLAEPTPTRSLPDHYSIRPADDSALADWAGTREGLRGDNTWTNPGISPLTTEVNGARTREI